MPGGGSAINRSVSLRIRRGRAAMVDFAPDVGRYRCIYSRKSSDR